MVLFVFVQATAAKPGDRTPSQTVLSTSHTRFSTGPVDLRCTTVLADESATTLGVRTVGLSLNAQTAAPTARRLNILGSGTAVMLSEHEIVPAQCMWRLTYRELRARRSGVLVCSRRIIAPLIHGPCLVLQVQRQSLLDWVLVQRCRHRRHRSAKHHLQQWLPSDRPRLRRRVVCQDSVEAVLVLEEQLHHAPAPAVQRC